jgi:hypothetical protein
MLKISKKQHTKILGYALIGYGLQFITYFLGLFKVLYLLLRSENSQTSNPDPMVEVLNHSLKDVAVFDIFTIQLLVFVVSLISGFSILISAKPKYVKYKFFSLVFVLMCITFFPLGTILSFYVLLYIFVLAEENN